MGKAKEFQLVIRLGGAEMRTPEHVAHALRSAAGRIEETESFDVPYIHDVNGNDVGHGRSSVVGDWSQPSYVKQVQALDATDARRILVQIATSLGAFAEWSGADMLESIAGTINGGTDMPAVSDQNDVEHAHWAAIAEDLGWDHDYESEEEDEEEDDDEDR